MALGKMLKFIKNLIYPPRCAFCSAVLPDDSEGLLCGECKSGLPVLGENVCTRCAREIGYCACSRLKLLFDGCAAPFYYEAGAKRAVFALKLGRREEIAKVMADFMGLSVLKSFHGAKFDAITYVPMTRVDLIKRGYNQARLLALNVGRMLDMPVLNLLAKTKLTKAQKTLSAAERAANLQSSIKAKKADIKGKTILIVDDVMTTGATLNECARALKAAGAEKVYATVFAVVK